MAMFNSLLSLTGTNEKPPATTCSAIAPTNDAAASAIIVQRWSSAQAMRLLYRSACRSNQALNRSSARAIGFRRSCASSCGSAQYAESIGSSENETNNDTSTAAAMVSANGLNHCPAMPGMNPTGTNTATIENVVAATASPISSVPCLLYTSDAADERSS